MVIGRMYFDLNVSSCFPYELIVATQFRLEYSMGDMISSVTGIRGLIRSICSLRVILSLAGKVVSVVFLLLQMYLLLGAHASKSEIPNFAF